MKAVFSGLLVCVACLAFGWSNEAVPKPFAIVISMDKPVVKAGSDVWIKVQMINTSTHDVDCTAADSNGVDQRFQYDVRDASGVPAEKKLSRHPELEGAGSFRLCTLKAGQSTTADDNLISKLFDMSRPGKYVIQVSRGVSDNPKDGIVKSNKVVVTVTP